VLNRALTGKNNTTAGQMGTAGVAMKYQDCAGALQADDAAARRRRDAARLAEVNINPSTGLASDYLNHFNEAIMLLEMLSSCPDCLDDFLDWRPMSYREHFEASRVKGRSLAIAAYDAADPSLRNCLDNLAATMTAVLEATRAAMSSAEPPQSIAAVADRAAALLRPLVARAGAVINGEDIAVAGEPMTPQAIVDGLMKD
jgi:hypothetical protein